MKENLRKIKLKFWWACEDCYDGVMNNTYYLCFYRNGRFLRCRNDVWHGRAWYPSAKYECVPKRKQVGWLYSEEARKNWVVIREQSNRTNLEYWLKENGIEDWTGIIGGLKD